ncbi:hypothetical protein [Paraburkholderia tropica]|uniref:hypothetical protein n=1 Tax=Paraburkholderia tropica TaxID=92647 RepID=UPI002AB62C56|nr:hypothetical protein [Paraburkholderia tropica]
MHLPHHQQMLREATPETLDSVIEAMRATGKARLHVETGADETLSQRRFFHQPASSVPMKSCVHIYVPPRKGAKATSKSSEATDALAAVA